MRYFKTDAVGMGKDHTGNPGKYAPQKNDYNGLQRR